MPKVGEQLTNGQKRLSPQQQKFLDNYLHRDMTQTAAARDAGYAHPNVYAVQLLNSPLIQERLEEMREEMRAKFGVTIEKSVRDLKAMRDQALREGKISAAIKAEELRLKATGLLVNKSHVTHENVDSMTKEQIIAKLREVMEKAQNRVIDVSPAEPEQNLIGIEDRGLTDPN
jgi:hypothetical protein